MDLALVKEESAAAELEEGSRGEGEGVEQGLDKPLDFLATYEERISARLLTSDLGNSTPAADLKCSVKDS